MDMPPPIKESLDTDVSCACIKGVSAVSSNFGSRTGLYAESHGIVANVCRHDLTLVIHTDRTSVELLGPPFQVRVSLQQENFDLELIVVVWRARMHYSVFAMILDRELIISLRCGKQPVVLVSSRPI